MPRNHKENSKYENNGSNRKSHTFMSPEDQAAGKKSLWTELEITGTIRNLSPNLFRITTLTGLYLKNNCLQRLPPDICQLINLRTLDVSYNKLRSLPAELGDLINLSPDPIKQEARPYQYSPNTIPFASRFIMTGTGPPCRPKPPKPRSFMELLLGHNILRILPYELGKLFNLIVLGLHGNPLNKDIMTLYSEPNGTHKLLTYMLDNLQDMIPVAMKLREQYGGLLKLFFGIRPRLGIMNYQAAEFLLGSTKILEKSYEYKFLHPWIGTGLLTSSNSKWRRQRKLITPTFHFQILEQFIDIFDAQSDILVKKWREEVVGKTFDLFPYISLCALDIICEAAMGTSVNAQLNSESDYVKNVKEMCRIVFDRAFSPIKMWDFLYPLSKDYQIEKRALKVLHGYTNYVIMKRREELAKTNCEKVDENDTGAKKRLAFLDLLLQSSIDGQPLSNESIREEVDTFMFEGHDTTTSGISFALYALSKHPEIQEKVVQELRTLFADDKNRSPSYQDLQDMKYLDMVIKESLRMYPPVPSYGRVLEEDVEFDGGILPKDLVLTVFSYGLHRDPDVFPNSEKFDPERFSPKNSVGRSPFAYVPFSAGPRNCIGQKFAVLEMKSSISKILRNFELLPAPGHEPGITAETILKSSNGLLVRLQERTF